MVTKLPGMFSAVSKFNEGQFKLVVKANTGLTLPPVMLGAPLSTLLGVNVFRSEPFLKPLAEGWVSENTSLIKSLPARLHPELEGIVRRGVMNGASVKTIKGQIKERYGVTDHRAKLIAQDQTLKLNADLTRYRLQSVGVKKYIWRSSQDSRVRPEHAERNGKTYSWEEGASGMHPGQEVRCRCHAEAIWDEKEIATPAPTHNSKPLRNTLPQGFSEGASTIHPGADERVWMTTDPDLAWSYARSAADRRGRTPVILATKDLSSVEVNTGRAVSSTLPVTIQRRFYSPEGIPEGWFLHGSSEVAKSVSDMYLEFNKLTPESLAADFRNTKSEERKLIIRQYVTQADIAQQFSSEIKRLKSL